MKKVCVITGGGSGMGLATAKLVCEEGYYTILVGRTASKLEKAVNDLRSAGGEAEAFSCDVSDRESCFALAKHAAECGEVKAILHIAGLSPHMGDAEKILRGNALGTVNINDAFYEVMAPGGCVIDTSSMSAYLAPQFVMPQGVYKLARTDREKFIKKLVELMMNHGIKKEDILAIFQKEAKDIRVGDMHNGEFDFWVRFPEENEDEYYYCFKDEGCHMIYHRFLPEDYADFGF